MLVLISRISHSLISFKYILNIWKKKERTYLAKIYIELIRTVCSSSGLHDRPKRKRRQWSVVIIRIIRIVTRIDACHTFALIVHEPVILNQRHVRIHALFYYSSHAPDRKRNIHLTLDGHANTRNEVFFLCVCVCVGGMLSSPPPLPSFHHLRHHLQY